MPKLLRVREVERALKKLGFFLARQSGGHAIYKNNDGVRIPVPIHGGKTITPGVFFAILKDLGMNEKESWNLK